MAWSPVEAGELEIEDGDSKESPIRHHQTQRCTNKTHFQDENEKYGNSDMGDECKKNYVGYGPHMSLSLKKLADAPAWNFSESGFEIPELT